MPTVSRAGLAGGGGGAPKETQYPRSLKMSEDLKRILVIKLGALGDFVLAFGPFAAIRAHHPGAHITLLTTPPFADLARKSPWFDAVLIDRRPSWWNMPALLVLARRLRGFDFTYDLQTSGRSARYFLLAGRPPWSGIAPGCSHPHANPRRNAMHTIERQRDQLRMAGIMAFPDPDLSWLTSGKLPTGLPDRFALLVPGAAAHRPEKRWPERHFGELAGILMARGLRAAIVGTRHEAPLAAAIQGTCPEALDLTGRTGLAELAAIAARASLAVGNDTGPMHQAATVGCPSVVLFSSASDPTLTAPRAAAGGLVRVLHAENLADLPVERVAAALP